MMKRVRGVDLKICSDSFKQFPGAKQATHLLPEQMPTNFTTPWSVIMPL